MNRRHFLRNSSLAGVSLASLSFAACEQTEEKTTPNASPEANNADDFILNEVTIDELQQKMKSGELSAEKITQLYLDRIAAIDKSGPKINAVIELNPDALAIAKQMDAERKSGKVRGALHGIPVLIKDNIDTADKMQTTAGALAMAGNMAKQDAFIVKKLREAGAVLLGKTNLSEWANFRSTNSCSGWSSRGGQTKCPYIIDRNPCGSSSGSGAAIAANLATIAIGTETDGSITCPSSINALAGIKPTVGLWSRSGIIPISSTQDTAGPMARTVRDAAILLGALTGEDTDDAATANSKGKAESDYTQYLKADGLQGKVIGVDVKKKSTNQYMNRLLEESLEALRKAGARVVEIDYVEEINKLGRFELSILQYEFKDGVNKYLAKAQHPSIKTLADVIAFNKKNEDKAMPYFKQEQLENCDKKGGLETEEYKTALSKGRDASRKIIDEVMSKNKLDAIVGLTMGPACAIDVVYGDRWGDDFLTQPAAMAGYPHITVPAGYIYDLPVGLSFFGTAYTEGPLISLAYSFEQLTKKRKKPGFKRSFLD